MPPGMHHHAPPMIPTQPGPGPQPAQEAPVPPSSAQSRTIFVGNIPYDACDSEIKQSNTKPGGMGQSFSSSATGISKSSMPSTISQILKLVGPFNTFRLKYDKDTEKPKGYGF